MSRFSRATPPASYRQTGRPASSAKAARWPGPAGVPGWSPTIGEGPSAAYEPSARRSRSPTWLSIIVRPSGAGSAAIRRPW